jgi:hypothetical protein
LLRAAAGTIFASYDLKQIGHALYESTSAAAQVQLIRSFIAAAEKSIGKERNLASVTVQERLPLKFIVAKFATVEWAPVES